MSESKAILVQSKECIDHYIAVIVLQQNKII